MTDYFDTSAYDMSVGWEYYSAQDVTPDDVYYSTFAEGGSTMDGFKQGFSKIANAVGNFFGTAGETFNKAVDYRLANWTPTWAAPEPEDNPPVIVNSGIDKQTLMIAGGVALALILVVAVKK